MVPGVAGGLGRFQALPRAPLGYPGVPCDTPGILWATSGFPWATKGDPGVPKNTEGLPWEYPRVSHHHRRSVAASMLSGPFCLLGCGCVCLRYSSLGAIVLFFDFFFLCYHHHDRYAECPWSSSALLLSFACLHLLTFGLCSRWHFAYTSMKLILRVENVSQ